MKKQDVSTLENDGETQLIDLRKQLLNNHQNLPLEYDDKITLLKWVCGYDKANLFYIVEELSQYNPIIVADIVIGNFLPEKLSANRNTIENCLQDTTQTFIAFLNRLNQSNHGRNKLWQCVNSLDFKNFDKLLNQAQKHGFYELRRTLIQNKKMDEDFVGSLKKSFSPQGNDQLKFKAFQEVYQGKLHERSSLFELSVSDFVSNELQLLFNAISNVHNLLENKKLIRDWLLRYYNYNPNTFLESITKHTNLKLDLLPKTVLDIITPSNLQQSDYENIIKNQEFELASSLLDKKLYELSKEHRHSPEEYHFHKRKKIENLLTITVKLATYNEQRCHQFFSHLINQLDPIDKYRVLNEVWSNAIGSDSIYTHFLELAIIAWSPGDSTEFIKRLIEGSPVIANEHMSGKHYKNVGINHILQTQHIQSILQQDHNLAKLLQNSQHLQNGETPLTQAIKDDDLEQAQRILHKGACINQRNKDNEFPLHIAIENNQTELVCYLIQQGADVVTPKTNKGNVAPTANNPQDLTEDETIRKLVKDNQPDERGHTKLSKAIMKEDSDTINEQLQQGANVNHLIYDNNKRNPPKTPLYDALSKNRLDIAQQLLQKGARLQIATDKSDGRFNVPYKDYSHEHPEHLFGHLNLLKQSHEIWEHAKFQNLNSYIENHIENLLDMISEEIADEGASKCVDQFTHKQWCKDDRDNYWKILHSTNDRVERYKRLPISNMQQWLRDNAYIQKDNQPIDFSQLLVDLKATLQSEMEHLSDSQQQKLQQLETMSQYAALYSAKLNDVLNDFKQNGHSFLSKVPHLFSENRLTAHNKVSELNTKIDKFRKSCQQGAYDQLKDKFDAIVQVMAERRYTNNSQDTYGYTNTLKNFRNELKANNQNKQFDLLIKGLDHIKQQNNINQNDLTFDNLLAQGSQQPSLDRSQERGCCRPSYS